MDQAEQQRLNKQLLEAARDGDTGAVVKVLLDHGANPNAKANDGWRPSHVAARGGHVPVVRLLEHQVKATQVGFLASVLLRFTEPTSRIEGPSGAPYHLAKPVMMGWRENRQQQALESIRPRPGL